MSAGLTGANEDYGTGSGGGGGGGTRIGGNYYDRMSLG
jgi:hypothetical protein